MAEDDQFDLRILIIDDSQRWQDLLRETLSQLPGRVQIDVAANYHAARGYIADWPYDLATVDLTLSGDFASVDESDALGMELLRELRASRFNRDNCALIVLSGYNNSARTRQAWKEYAVDDSLDKNTFDDQIFLPLAQAAIRNTRLRRAAAHSNVRYRLNITLGDGALLGSDLTGPNRQAGYQASRPAPFDKADLTRRGDMLHTLLLQTNGDAAAWRQEARSLGAAVYRALGEDRRIFDDLVAARALAGRFNDLALRFSGTSASLGVPFELLRDDDDYLGLKHVLTRRILLPSGSLSHKPDPFHSFVEAHTRNGERLRVLVIGANSDGRIPGAEEEAAAVAALMGAGLALLGIDHEVTPLIGAAASYQNVTRALRSGRYHMVHYAGHGRYHERLPEISDLVLHDERGGYALLSASDLNLLVRNTDLQLVFLSCCLGARTAQQVGRGEFAGVLEALVRADVPVVLGYRWAVADTPARDLALRFYRQLWRSFLPGDALLHARTAMLLDPAGRDGETWAAPILVEQNG
jgi:CheY-like chemotaxis protein